MKTKIFSIIILLSLFFNVIPVFANSYEIIDEGAYGSIVEANVDSSFSIQIPKTIKLEKIDEDTFESNYSINIIGDISGDEKLSVIPDSTITLVSSGKDNVVATVTQDKTKWIYSELNTVASGNISVDGITAGNWEGFLNFDIELSYMTYIKSKNGAIMSITEASSYIFNKSAFSTTPGDFYSQEVVDTLYSYYALDETTLKDNDYGLPFYNWISNFYVPEGVEIIEYGTLGYTSNGNPSGFGYLQACMNHYHNVSFDDLPVTVYLPDSLKEIKCIGFAIPSKVVINYKDIDYLIDYSFWTDDYDFENPTEEQTSIMNNTEKNMQALLKAFDDAGVVYGSFFFDAGTVKFEWIDNSYNN